MYEKIKIPIAFCKNHKFIFINIYAVKIMFLYIYIKKHN